MKTCIEFLNQILENRLVSPFPEKIKAMMRFLETTSMKQVQSFFDFAGYFHKFISEYSTTAKLLSDLLWKDKKFQFGEAKRKAFNELKRILKHNVLQIFDSELETELHMDASQDGICTILVQRSPMNGKLHSAQYMSRKSQSIERKYKSYKLEVLAVTEKETWKFRIYLLGRKFKIVMDCAAFTQMMQKKEVSPKIWR